jgi:hypothetical protein
MGFGRMEFGRMYDCDLSNNFGIRDNSIYKYLMAIKIKFQK